MCQFDGSYTHPTELEGKLQKNLYGSKPAGYINYNGLTEPFHSHGIKQTEADSCLFLHRREHMIAYIAVTIDDFLIAADEPADTDAIL